MNDVINPLLRIRNQTLNELSPVAEDKTKDTTSYTTSYTTQDMVSNPTENTPSDTSSDTTNDATQGTPPNTPSDTPPHTPKRPRVTRTKASNAAATGDPRGAKQMVMATGGATEPKEGQIMVSWPSVPALGKKPQIDERKKITATIRQSLLERLSDVSKETGWSQSRIMERALAAYLGMPQKD